MRRPVTGRTLLRLAALIAAAGLSVSLGGACRRTPATPADPVAAAALRVVEEARGPGIGTDTIDEGLVELVRRVQLVKRTTLDTMKPAALLAAFAGDAGPDKQYAREDRPRMQRERATRGILATLSGACTAERFDAGRDGRVQFLTEPIPGDVPAEIVAGVADLARRLSSAQAARVRCAKGDLAFLFVAGEGGRLRVVDVFEVRQNAIEVHPDDPSMR